MFLLTHFLNVKDLVHDVMAACQKEDNEALLMALEGVPKTEKDLLPYYLRALKSAHYATVNDIIQIIVEVNETVEDVRQKGSSLLILYTFIDVRLGVYPVFGKRENLGMFLSSHFDAPWSLWCILTSYENVSFGKYWKK